MNKALSKDDLLWRSFSPCAWLSYPYEDLSFERKEYWLRWNVISKQRWCVAVVLSQWVVTSVYFDYKNTDKARLSNPVRELGKDMITAFSFNLKTLVETEEISGITCQWFVRSSVHYKFISIEIKTFPTLPLHAYAVIQWKYLMWIFLTFVCKVRPLYFQIVRPKRKLFWNPTLDISYSFKWSGFLRYSSICPTISTSKFQLPIPRWFYYWKSLRKS